MVRDLSSPVSPAQGLDAGKAGGGSRLSNHLKAKNATRPAGNPAGLAQSGGLAEEG